MSKEKNAKPYGWCANIACENKCKGCAFSPAESRRRKGLPLRKDQKTGLSCKTIRRQAETDEAAAAIIRML